MAGHRALNAAIQVRALEPQPIQRSHINSEVQSARLSREKSRVRFPHVAPIFNTAA